MSRAGQRRKNWAVLAVLTLIMLAALIVVVLEFADPATKGRLYGWLPASKGAATQETQPQGR